MRVLRASLLLAGLFVTPALLSAQVSDTRTDAQRAHLRAIPVTEPIRLDGVLDEGIWGTAEPATGFVQAEPQEGQPSSERSEVRVAFDGDNLYIGAMLFDGDPDALVVTDIKKDFAETTQDAFSVILDTFRDRRNGYVFSTNPEGARADQQVASEGREINASWDAVWRVRTARTPDGWSVEMEIPFLALRFE
ncbi:MAG: carbohydrate binding family 9 domain-containing protein [Gemmatimonadetes bacterium]|nr:carbohydrate binding family 9 domain-containing protein [Gemmatimonadota bacterium]